MLFVILCNSCIGKAQTGIVFFKGTWQEAVIQAQQENKMILVDCYTTWCVPCKKLSNDVFPIKAMGDFFNKNFINIQIDMEKGIGKELFNRFEINSFPTLVIANSKGFKISEILGLREYTEYLRWAKGVVDQPLVKSDDERFFSGERSESFLKNYFRDLLKVGKLQKARASLDTIYSEQGEAILNKKLFWDLSSLVSIDSKLALDLVRNKAKLYTRYTKDSVDARIREIYISKKELRYMFKMPYSAGLDSGAYQAFVNKLSSRSLPDKDFMMAETEFYILYHQNKYDEAFSLLKKTLDGAPAWKHYDLLSLANWELTNPSHRANILEVSKSAAEKYAADKYYGPILSQIYDELLTRGMGSFYPAPRVWGILL